MLYKLVLINTNKGMDSATWVLSLPATIGRSSDNDVCVNHDTISRTHCRLSLNGEGALVIRDLNSMNGTYVDDNKITQSVLMLGETFQLGAITFRLDYASDADREQARERPLTFDLSTTVPMPTLNTSSAPRSQSSPDAEEDEKKWWKIW